MRALTAPIACACLIGPTYAADNPAKSLKDTPGPSGLTLDDFLAPPEFSSPQLSPSGKKLALVKRVGEEDLVLLLDVADRTKARAIFNAGPVKPELAKKGWRRWISYLNWKTEDSLLISVSGPVSLDRGLGPEIYEEPIHMVVAVDGKSPPLILNASREGRTDWVSLSEIQNVLRGDPDHVLLTSWPKLAAVEAQKVNIHTGALEVLDHGDTDIVGYGSDRQGNVITRTLQRGEGWLVLQGRAPGEKKWVKIIDFRRKQLHELGKYDFLGVGEVGTIYVAANPDSAKDGDTKSVRSFDLKTMSLGPVVWSHPKYDVDQIVQDEDTGKIIGGCYWVDTYTCDFTDVKLTSNLKGLGKYFENQQNVFIVSQSDDDKLWILEAEGPGDRGSYYFYDVDRHEIDLLVSRYTTLKEGALARVRRFGFKTRDGVDLAAYVSEPPGTSPRPRPLVVMPHGGPEARDKYTFDFWAQYLASRGYVILQPNFRGSGGFGRKFAEAGYGQWGGLMHDDVMDATRALIAEGKVDKERVCIVGGSYGGYEAMYAAATEPDVFKCAVSLDGVSDLVGNLKFERARGADSLAYAYWRKSQGDPTVDGPRMLARSPYRLAGAWRTPMLLIHGDKDDIVPVEESRQMQRALAAAGKPVRYVEVPGMGHGPESDEEITKVYLEIEGFLATYLGGPKPPPAQGPAAR